MASLTIIESPFAGDVERNKIYLARCIEHSMTYGETPFASHGFYTQYLDDTNEKDRELGMKLGREFWRYAVNMVFYVDYGMSPGMEDAMYRVSRMHNDSGDQIGVEFRRIGKNKND